MAYTYSPVSQMLQKNSATQNHFDLDQITRREEMRTETYTDLEGRRITEIYEENQLIQITTTYIYIDQAGLERVVTESIRTSRRRYD